MPFQRALEFVCRSQPALNHLIPRPANLFDHCSCSDSDKYSRRTTVGLSCPPQNFRSPRPANGKKGGVDMNASPSSLLSSLIFFSARSIDHVCDLHPASFFSSMRLVSSWMTVISLILGPSPIFAFVNKANCGHNCPPLYGSWFYACSDALCLGCSCSSFTKIFFP